LSGFNDNYSVADGGQQIVRPYFFALPIGECTFVSYINTTSGGGGTWDWEQSNHATEPRHLETQLTFQILLDNEPFTPAPEKELLVELEFETC